jgi:hypothetical protein
MSCKGTPNFVAAEVEADLVLCDLTHCIDRELLN